MKGILSTSIAFLVFAAVLQSTATAIPPTACSDYLFYQGGEAPSIYPLAVLGREGFKGNTLSTTIRLILISPERIDGIGKAEWILVMVGEDGWSKPRPYSREILLEIEKIPPNTYKDQILFVAFLDSKGNESKPYVATIRIDRRSQPIQVKGLEMDSERIGSTEVIINLSKPHDVGVDLPGMQFSNDGISWSDPEPFAVSKQWKLEDVAAGTEDWRVAGVRFLDSKGNSYGPYIDTIFVDKKPPSPLSGFGFSSQDSVDSQMPRIIIRSKSNSAGCTDSASVILDLIGVVRTKSGMRPAVNMKLRNDGGSWSEPEPFVSMKKWVLEDIEPGKANYRKVSVSFQDSEGNWSVPIADTIILDRR